MKLVERTLGKNVTQSKNMRTIIIRTSLIVAIIAGVAVIQLHVTQLKKKMTALHGALTTRTAALEKTEADLAGAREEINKSAAALKRTADALNAKTTEVDAKAKEITKLNDDLNKLREERDNAQAQLSAYRVSMPTPEQVAHAANKIKTLQDSLAASQEENALLGRRIKRLEYLMPNNGIDPVTFPPI